MSFTMPCKACINEGVTGTRPHLSKRRDEQLCTGEMRLGKLCDWPVRLTVQLQGWTPPSFSLWSSISTTPSSAYVSWASSKIPYDGTLRYRHVGRCSLHDDISASNMAASTAAFQLLLWGILYYAGQVHFTVTRFKAGNYHYNRLLWLNYGPSARTTSTMLVRKS